MSWQIAAKPHAQCIICDFYRIAGRRWHFFLAELLFTNSAADDGARAIGADADVGFAWSGAAAMVPAPVEGSQLRGHRQRSPNSAASFTASTISVTLARARARGVAPIPDPFSFFSSAARTEFDGAAVGGAQKKLVPSGHIGLFMGARNLKEVWPSIARWIPAH